MLSANLFFSIKRSFRVALFSRKNKGFAIKDFTSIWGIRLSSKCYFYYSGLSILIYLFYAKHLGTGTKKAQNRLGFSGGGAKVFSYWVLKVLEEAGVQIDYIGGTSMGAVVGGLTHLGTTPVKLILFFKQLILMSC
jgi:NTE family protein